MMPVREELLNKLIIPDIARFMLEQEDAKLYLSVSGGADSQATCILLQALYNHYNWRAEVHLIHADLGRAEWPITKTFVQKQAELYGLPLHTVHHPKYGTEQVVWSGNGYITTFEYDLVDLIWDNAKNRSDKPTFPSSLARYCTSTLKTRVITHYFNHAYKTNTNILCAMGLLAAESKKRREKDPFTKREKSYSKQKNRLVYNWLPVHQFTKTEIWEVIGYSREELREIRHETSIAVKSGNMNIANLLDTFSAHPAYALGNSRLSCVLCILANKNDLRNGAQHNPDLFREYSEIELQTESSFKNDMSLAQLEPSLLTKNQRERLARLETGNPRFRKIPEKTPVDTEE